MTYSRRSSPPRDRTHISHVLCIADRFLQNIYINYNSILQNEKTKKRTIPGEGRHTQGEHSMTMESDTEAQQLQAKECLRLLEGQEISSPRG